MNSMSTDGITNLLKTFLDVQSRRAQVIASNIANADTPGYAAKELNFDEYLQKAANEVELPFSQRTSRNVSAADLNVVDRTPTTIGLDGNTVDTGLEMSELAQSGIDFNFGAKMLQARFRLLRSAISGGR
ncbi:MAG: flagellar basal body rod protein FlgB [Pyrinomonadaceae bacterium]|nr:flagellar basal body rod protein FlgB [Pyrinomonadaceae bacterium]